MTMFELVVFWTLTSWFLFYLINHAEMEILKHLRTALGPWFPKWFKKLLSCALCWTFWFMSAMTLFTGYIPLIVMCPPVALLWDLAFRRLNSFSK